jgi:hypothetical protein
MDIESRWTGIKSALQRSCGEILGQSKEREEGIYLTRYMEYYIKKEKS